MMKRTALLATVLALGPVSAQAEPCAWAPKQIVSQFLDAFYGQGKVRAAFMAWVDPGYIQHNPFAANGRDAAIAFLEPFVAAHPEWHGEIKRVIAEGDLVVVHSHVRWTKSDRGNAVVDIFRVAGCKVVEHWDVLQPVPETSANANTMF
ncbi:nuclear transport factor 2 family protein [Novosphingobium sp. FSW06-99]|uniref:nuclear transport factor 2 family protein n=1 Tax=Novosphingobium sp. FSW06-99 TaxID=1739113 RepID=UPI0009EA9F03|nr:nuclear transport factor 2 family protein [Novosphingobium sp. FSW06-99]